MKIPAIEPRGKLTPVIAGATFGHPEKCSTPESSTSEAERIELQRAARRMQNLASTTDALKLSRFSPWGAHIEAACDAGDRELALAELALARVAARASTAAACEAAGGDPDPGLPCLSSATFVRSEWPTPVRDSDVCGILPTDPPFLDECLRRTLLIPTRDHWAARASERFAVANGPELDDEGLPIDRALAARQYVYATQRVQSLGRDITPKLKRCGSTVFPIACGCASSRAWAAQTCRQTWLCRTCRKARARKIAGKVEVALDARFASEQARAKAGAFGWDGFMSTIRIVLVTLTVRHSGDPARDRDRILRGWQNVRKRYHEEWGRFPSVLVWEVTPGEDGLGHMHAHVACVWPHRSWKQIRRWWLAGTHDGRVPTNNLATSRINFSTGFHIKGRSRRAKKEATTPRSMARYLAKYISKGADSSDFSHELSAQVSAAFYNQRSIVTSHRFWLPRDLKCPCCGLVKTKARGLVSEWFDRDPPPGPDYDANAPPDDMLDSLERGGVGFVWLS